MMMQIVTDSGCDLSDEQKKGLPIHVVPLGLVLNGVSYDKNHPITPAEFYQKMVETDVYPSTSQASAGDFADVYRELSANGEEILSIHISSGLSGTLNSAKVGGALVPNAKITYWDSKTLSSGLGWQVQAAALAIKKGWSLDKILERLALIRDQVDGMFTLKEMRYLIHGGRVSHLEGLMAQVLNVKPIIAVEHEKGTYVTAGKLINFKRALAQIVEINYEKFKNEKVRAQIVHGINPEGVEYLKEKLQEKLDVVFEEVLPVSPVLGAHTGPTLTGLIIGPMSFFADLI